MLLRSGEARAGASGQGGTLAFVAIDAGAAGGMAVAAFMRSGAAKHQARNACLSVPE